MQLTTLSVLLVHLLTFHTPPVGPIVVGRSVVPLDGPRRFQIGDNVLWADSTFDDATWETVDLTPGAGAHDPDVGLAGYVDGWGARGHAGYAGYAWYRLRVSVAASPGDTLAIDAPLQVDDAYELFVDGQRLGGSGDFSGRRPVAYSTRPLMIVLPRAPALIAVRVWVDPSTMRDDPSAGGIRIAPAIGRLDAITGLHQLEWLKKFTGYVVDAVEPVAFICLALMALILTRFDPADRAYGWLAAALLLLAMRRGNQAVFFWMPYESAPVANVVTNVLLTPVVLGVWTVTWWRWFDLRRGSWAMAATGALTALYIVTQATDRPTLAAALRICFALLYVLTLYGGMRRRRRDRVLSVLAALLMAVALFATELSRTTVPGIWFPFGTGVSRTQYALGGFVVVMAALLLQHLISYAAKGGSEYAGGHSVA